MRAAKSDHARWLVLLAVGALGVSCVMTQLALMREFLCAFSGNELVVGAILGSWLLLTGLGSRLGQISERLRNPLRALLIAQLFVAILPLVQVFALRALRNVVFERGVTVGMTETVVSSLVLLLPYCIFSGFFLTLACAVLAWLQGGAGVPPDSSGLERVRMPAFPGGSEGGSSKALKEGGALGSCIRKCVLLAKMLRGECWKVGRRVPTPPQAPSPSVRRGGDTAPYPPHFFGLPVAFGSGSAGLGTARLTWTG